MAPAWPAIDSGVGGVGVPEVAGGVAGAPQPTNMAQANAKPANFFMIHFLKIRRVMTVQRTHIRLDSSARRSNLDIIPIASTDFRRFSMEVIAGRPHGTRLKKIFAGRLTSGLQTVSFPSPNAAQP